MTTVLVAILLLNCVSIVCSTFGPPYPITAAVFKGRNSTDEWGRVIDHFKKQGGDTIILRAPPIRVRSKLSLDNDPDFASCGASSGVQSCYEAVTADLTNKGLGVSAVTTYGNDEIYRSSMLRCSGFDKKLQGANNREYIRIVLPTTPVSADCVFPKGTEVVVVVSEIARTDNQEVLLKTAKSKNVDVILGLPAQPLQLSIPTVNLTHAYLTFVERVLLDQQARYAAQYSSVTGYYSRDEVVLTDDIVSLRMHKFNNLLSGMVHAVGKKILLSADINLNVLVSNKTISDHIEGFSKLSNWTLTKIDIIAVHEGRGFGKGGLFWPTQQYNPINATDPSLFRILQSQFRTITEETKFTDVFSGSVQELFHGLHNFKTQHQNSSELWLLLESFEDLKDDLCLPVDQRGSGNPLPMDRTSKSRIDNSLTSAGAAVRKVMAFAYDPDFTCTTKKYAISLVDEISQDLSRPIISNCSFHSSTNRSVVVLGYSLEAETQGFQVDWPDRDGKRHHDHTYGYYFELDYGEKHRLVPSLVYIQLYDPYDVISLADHGYVKVQAENSYHDCQFEFNFRNLNET